VVNDTLVFKEHLQYHLDFELPASWVMRVTLSMRLFRLGTEKLAMVFSCRVP